MVGSPIYILHIISNIYNPFEQKSFSMCINEFMNEQWGHFESGKWVPDPFDTEHVVYYREEMESGIYPPAIIVDTISWLNDRSMWMLWMVNFERITITRHFVVE